MKTNNNKTQVGKANAKSETIKVEIMKKTIIMIIMVLVSINAFGQYHRTTIHTSYGTYTVSTSTFGHFTSVYVNGPRHYTTSRTYRHSTFTSTPTLKDERAISPNITLKHDSIRLTRKVEEISEFFKVSYDTIYQLINSIDNDFLFAVTGSHTLKFSAYDDFNWWLTDKDFDLFVKGIKYAYNLENQHTWQYRVKDNPYHITEPQKYSMTGQYNYSTTYESIKRVAEYEIKRYMKKIIVQKYPELVNKRQYKKYVKYQEIV